MSPAGLSESEWCISELGADTNSILSRLRSMKRQQDGKFKDEDLANILQNA